MGNLDFLEKKTKYAISWDGVLEGKETFTNKGFANDDPADIWCKISTVPFTEGAFCKTNYNIINCRGFSAENAGISASCYECTMRRYFSSKYEYILFQVNNSDSDSVRFTVVHTDVDNVTISERSEFQYNSITFPTAGWWISATKNGTSELGAMNTIMTIDIAPQLSISGKGFTSPQKPYRQFVRPFDSDDDILIAINNDFISKEFTKFFNGFCVPGSPSIKADIKLDEDLANIYMHSMSHHLSVAHYSSKAPDEYNGLIQSNYYIANSCVMDIEVYEDDNPGMRIILEGMTIYYDPSISQNDLDDWWDKYLSRIP